MSGVPNGSADFRLRQRGWDVSETGCWNARGSLTSGGYGYIKFNGRRTGMHQLAYETWVGPIKSGEVIRHRCDNRKCINPEHLETGTHADNMHDMITRGRSSKGDRHWNVRLSDRDVLDIRKEYNMGILTHQMLADVYGVSRAAITKRIGKAA